MAKKDFKAGLGSIIPDQTATPAPIVAKAPVKKAKPETIKHSMTLDKEQFEKIRYIVAEERTKIKKVVFDAFKAYIRDYEKKNGTIEL